MGNGGQIKVMADTPTPPAWRLNGRREMEESARTVIKSNAARKSLQPSAARVAVRLKL